MAQKVGSRIGPVFVGPEGLRAGWRFLLFALGVELAGVFVQGLALHGTSLLWFGLLWLGANVLVGLNEEYLFRGYVLRALWRGAGFWPAALMTTAVFAGLHLSKSHENAMDIGMIFVLGLAI